MQETWSRRRGTAREDQGDSRAHDAGWASRHGRSGFPRPVVARFAGPAAPHNLPLALTSFVGREREIAVVRRLLDQTRLLTLAGVGGIGKTRLALEVADDLVAAYRDGAWLVELAALTDPALVPRAVASALGVPEQRGRPLTETLTDYLAQRSLLLVLDNCEHLAGACAGLADDLLRASPGLQILVTSRHGLNVAGETTWQVPPLSLPRLPASNSSGDAAPVLESEAMRLFVERARAASPGFELTGDSAAAVGEICARLDGIPLAIELAAARIRVLTPTQIAARLDDRFRLLTTGSATVLPRHQTLRGMMDWSYQLLSPPERVLLRRLAVFVGGWTLEAAEAVAGDGSWVMGDGGGSPSRSPITHDPSPILDVLAGLVDKSLVLVGERGGEARYGLLETVRQYAEEKLHEAGEEAFIRDRHAAWFLSLAEHARSGLTGPDRVPWLDQLDREHDNLRAALAWLRDAGQAEPGLSMGWALWRFWSARGYLAEGRTRLAELLALEGASAGSMPRAEVLFGAGRLAYVQGDYAAARPLFEESHAIARQVGDAEHIAASLTQLGHLARAERRYAAARSLYLESLAIRRDLGRPHPIALTLLSLGVAAHLEGDLTGAGSCYAESLALATEAGDQGLIVDALNDSGELALDRADASEARAHFAQGLTLAHRAGDRPQIAVALEGLAGLAALEGRPRLALHLAGAAAALREEIGAPLPPAEGSLLERRLATAERALGERASAEAWAAGRATAVEQATRDALAAGTEPDLPAAPQRVATTGRPLADDVSALTRREREVVGLIARGLTNRRIAAELVVGETTVDTHVRHILNKLGFATRVQVAAWAVEHGLAAPRL